MEKYCKRRGSPKTWQLFQRLAEGTGIEVVESDCLDECMTGPNIRIDGLDSRIHGGITDEDKVRGVLGLEKSGSGSIGPQ